MVTTLHRLRAGGHARCRDTAGRARARQTGAMLLEVLIAILIFSFGILGIVGLQAQSIRHVNEAQYRSEAIFLANAFVSQIWADDRTSVADPTYLTTTYSDAGGGAGYLAFYEMVQTLPGAALSGNAPTVTFAAGPSTTSTLVTVTVFWQLPGETTPHNYSTTAVIGLNRTS